jgi:hypothetical protein
LSRTTEFFAHPDSDGRNARITDASAATAGTLVGYGQGYRKGFVKEERHGS